MARELQYEIQWNIEEFTARRDTRHSKKFWCFEKCDPVFDPLGKAYDPSCIVSYKSGGNYREKEVSEFYLKFDGDFPKDLRVEVNCSIRGVNSSLFYGSNKIHVKDDEVFLYSVVTKGATLRVEDKVMEYSREHDFLKIEFSFYLYFNDSIPRKKRTITPAVNSAHKKLKLCSDFKNLYDSKEMADITIIVGDDFLLAHKLVLVTRSHVLKAIIYNDCLESTKTIRITDFDASVFDNFLKYLYFSEICDKSLVMVLNLYVLAEKYAVDDLKEDCRDILEAELNEGTVCQLLEMPHLLIHETLKDMAVEFVKQHFSAVSKKPEWLKICQDHPAMASYVFRTLTLFLDDQLKSNSGKKYNKIENSS